MRTLTYTLWEKTYFDTMYELELCIQVSDVTGRYILFIRHANTRTERHTRREILEYPTIDLACQKAKDVFDEYKVPSQDRRSFFESLKS